jgi:CheY-like chemotaxis protein
MEKTVLWIDDSAQELQRGLEILNGIPGITSRSARSSAEAQQILEGSRVDAVVSDILRRDSRGRPTDDDGYDFVYRYIRPTFPKLPVIFHTKNACETFEVDGYSQYLAKWEPQTKKAIELECRLTEAVALYEAFADWSTWQKIEPRLVSLQSDLLRRLRKIDDIWSLNPDQFEQLVGELLEASGFSVLWVPGGNDGGVDIVAGSNDRRFLIDVKRYAAENPVTVELVRRVYGVAESVSSSLPNSVMYGGIITSSRFTHDARTFRNTLRRRPLLRDGSWLKEELTKYAPRVST